MTHLRRGDVVDVYLDPTRGSETGKVRPAVVVTNDRYNARVPIVQVVPVTSWSERKAAILTNVEIEPTRENGLASRSVADCLQTRPLDRRFRVRGVRGRVDSETMARLEEALRIVFSL